jgi:hypothetical protein
VDIDGWLAAGQTTWDAHPNTCGAKMDAETCGLKAALAQRGTLDGVSRQNCAFEAWMGDRVSRRKAEISLETLSAPIIVVAAVLCKQRRFPAGVGQ